MLAIPAKIPILDTPASNKLFNIAINKYKNKQVHGV
jgi:hypothetical protein